MSEPTLTVVLQTESEVEIQIYAAVLREAGVPVLIQAGNEPVVLNPVGRFPQPLHQLLVPSEQAAYARELIEANRPTPEELAAVEEEEPEEEAEEPHSVFSLQSFIVWFILLAYPVAWLIVTFIKWLTR